MSGLVELGRYPDAALAHILRGRLEAAGIHAVCFDSGMNAAEGVPMMIGVRLMVLEEDRAEARAALDLAQAETVFGEDVFAGEVFDDDAWAPDADSDLAGRRSRLLNWGAVLLGAAFLLPLLIAGLAN
jgi:hypothetical protein